VTTVPARLGLIAIVAPLATCCGMTAAAEAADLRIFSPIVEAGRVELENNSSVSFDRSPRRNNQQSHFGEIGYGVTDFWRTEIEGNWEGGDGGIRLRTLDNENIFHVLKSAKTWLDLGLLEEYDHAVDGHTPDTLTLGTLFQKEIGPSQTIVDVFFDRQFGRHAMTGTTLRYAGRSVWEIAPLFAPGIEFYGQPGRVSRLPDYGLQDHRLGPGIAGRLEIEGFGEIGYDVAYVFGLTPATPKETVVWRLELGIRF
jgi:hypothetical protein